MATAYKYMGVRPKKVESFTGVGFGNRAALKLPSGETYDFLIIETNLQSASINIRCILGGKTFYDAPATVFDMIDDYKDVIDYAGFVPAGKNYIIVPFADLSLRYKDGQQQTSLVTMYGEEFLLEVDIAAKGAGDPDNVELVCHPLVNTPQAQRVFLPRLEKHTITAPAAGENQFSSIPSVQGRSIRRIHFHSNAITEIAIRRDGDESYRTQTAVEKYRGARNGRTWVDGWWHLDFLQRGYIANELFPTVRASELLFSLYTNKVEGNVDAYIEYLDVERPDILQAAAQQAAAS